MLRKAEVKYENGPVSIHYTIGYALGIAERIFRSYGHDLVVTSLMDGTHNPGSLHTTGKAADLRVKHITETGKAEAIFGELKMALTSLGFDVVWEGGVGATPFTTGAHIHIEYDPKTERTFWKLVG